MAIVAPATFDDLLHRDRIVGAEKKHDVRDADIRHFAGLDNAEAQNDVETVTLDAAGANGWTPLMHAVVNGNEQIVKLLLTQCHDGELNKFTKDDWNPLSAAIMHEQLKIVDMLFDAGACVNTIKRRHTFAHEQYLHAQKQSEARRAATRLQAEPYAMYVRNYDQCV